MSDPTPPATGQAAGTSGPATTGISVPEDVQKKYGDLIALVKASESMNDEERQYWINILPIMTPEQVQNLRDILENERKQLAAIDAKYQPAITTEEQKALVQKTAEERAKKRSERLSKEAAHKADEAEKTEDILKQIENV